MVLTDNAANQLEIALPLRDQITDILRQDIISGKLKSGEKISERDISLRFNVSTAPAKEAIRTLNMEGLLQTFPRKGTYVSDIFDSNLVQMVHLRGVIEGVGAYWGTKNITDQDIDKMENCLKLFSELLKKDLNDKEVIDQITQTNYSFHRILSIAAKNSYLDQLILTMGSINNTIRQLYYRTYVDAKDYQISFEEHKAIYEAVRKRDPDEAEAITVKHIRRVADSVLDKADLPLGNEEK